MPPRITVPGELMLLLLERVLLNRFPWRFALIGRLFIDFLQKVCGGRFGPRKCTFSLLD